MMNEESVIVNSQSIAFTINYGHNSINYGHNFVNYAHNFSRSLLLYMLFRQYLFVNVVAMSRIYKKTTRTI